MVGAVTMQTAEQAEWRRTWPVQLYVETSMEGKATTSARDGRVGKGDWHRMPAVISRQIAAHDSRRSYPDNFTD